MLFSSESQPLYKSHRIIRLGTPMTPQYPDQQGQRAGESGLAGAMMCLSHAVKIETVSCLAYLIALAYTSKHLVALMSWIIGKPTTVVLAHRDKNSSTNERNDEMCAGVQGAAATSTQGIKKWQ